MSEKEEYKWPNMGEMYPADMAAGRKPSEEPFPIVDAMLPHAADVYQDFTSRVAVYPRDTFEIEMAYLALGLSGEAGEVAEKIKKHIRGDNDGLSLEEYTTWKENVLLELGDAVWYIARMAAVLDCSFTSLMNMNIAKLESRMERDKLKGNGDNR